ncbi:FKBP-like protein [Suhomyces tanzawaensis NRRL Y-17324]|uniref:FK506-binding protein n=1 Tax=Suhomyces tanzawaensis NRRL Y-17324 TaxID=984487 RepID=A0A1E4SMM3_9ASCO|nr:FKBP-like protein [Suhomyces tanzawaensis NRRL Y-17324]ODV80779.1 FKBP-like protein [Suhomyces tanzawaensis NRRL Y-17324]
MASLIPISTYNLAVQPFNPVPAIEDDYPVTIRLTLAAVDPEALDDKEEPSTLRLLKRTLPFLDDEEDSDLEAEEADELDSEEEEEEVEEAPKKKGKKAKKAEEEEVDEDEEDLDIDGSDDDEDEDDISEFVVCTLSPKVQFQQTIDLTISPDEEVFFVVTGSYAIHLTGNYVEHPADEDSDEDEEYDEDDYDLSPDEDEIIHGDGYDLDDLEDESDIENKIEELVENDKKSKKRAAEEDEQEQPPSKKDKKKKEEKKSVQFTKELEQGPTGSTLVDKKKEKKEKAKAKKEEAEAKKEEAKKDESNKDEAGAKKYPTKTLLGGVVTEDRKVGKGPAAKSGNRVGIRYIGKLKNGKVFDKNTSGKPFVFGLGKGECIKGFDLGVAGMAVGGERRVVIPAKMGYGSQSLPGIPANSELTFDIKLVSLK